MRILALMVLLCFMLSGCGTVETPDNRREPVEAIAETELPEKSNTKEPEDRVTIKDITKWNHPVKSVLEQNNIRIIRLELTHNNTYPTFYVVFPSDMKEKDYNEKLIKAIAKENGYWDYTLLDESKNIRIDVLNDIKNKTVKSYIINGEKTDISGLTDIRSECKKYSEFLNINGKAASKLIKEDIDKDGKLEILIAFNDEYGLKIYLLREIGNGLHKIGEIEGQGYGVYDVNLVKLRGSNHEYIKTLISNGDQLEGFALYQIVKDEVQQIEYSASATGVGEDELTSTTGNDIYDGYVQHRHSYDVLYFGVSRSYKWDGKSFVYTVTRVNTGDYPDKPEEVIDQFLKLNMLWAEDRKSKDVEKRLQEINVSKKILNVDKIMEATQNVPENNFLSDLRTGCLEFNIEKSNSAIFVTVFVLKSKLRFTLENKEKRWKIVDIDGNFVLNKK